MFRNMPSQLEENAKFVKAIRSVYSEIFPPLENELMCNYLIANKLPPIYFESKPIITFIGPQYSGKTTAICYLLDEKYPGANLGSSGTTEHFTFLSKGQTAVHNGKNFKAISGLVGIADDTVENFKGVLMQNSLLDYFHIVDTPGIKPNWRNSHPIIKAFNFIASYTTRTVYVADCMDLTFGSHLSYIFSLLEEHIDTLRFVLNKSGNVDNKQLMKSYGTFLWTLAREFKIPEPLKIFIGSFWDKPMSNITNFSVINRCHQDFFSELSSLPTLHPLTMLNRTIFRSRKLKVLMHLLNYVKSTKKMVVTEEEIDQIYLGLQETQRDLHLCDFPTKSSFLLYLKNTKKIPTASKKHFKKLEEFDEKIKPLLEATEGYHLGEKNIKIKGGIFLLFDEFDFDDYTVQKLIAFKEAKCDSVFRSLNPVKNRLSYKQIKPLYASTKIPKEILHSIFTLADIDCNGKFSDFEFAILQYLVEHKLNHKELPQFLPEDLVEHCVKQINELDEESSVLSSISQ